MDGRRLRRLLTLLCLIVLSAAPKGRQPQPVDTSTIGPRVGTTAPEFSGSDQNGRLRTLKAAAGPNGTMLVFFRSADW